MSTKVTLAGEDQGRDGLTGRVPPLSVSLIGLAERPYLPVGESASSVYSVPTDFSNRLHFLSSQIIECFTSEGFEEHFHPNTQVLRPNLINNSKGRTYVPMDENGRMIRKRMQPNYDARSLIEKYKGIVLADNILLEKLSLCQEGRKATFFGPGNEVLIDEYYEEIESIPMPQER